MKITVIGATGPTGREITDQLLKAGHEVSALVRDPSRLDLSHPNLTTTVGDVFSDDRLEKAMGASQAVVIALGSGNSLGKTTIRSQGTQRILEIMAKLNITRVLAISAMGTGDSWNQMGMINRLFYALLLKHSRADHEAQEAAITSTRLDWTIIRPSGLTNNPGTGTYLMGEGIRAKTSQIPRADVADCVVRVLNDPSYYRKAITVTN